MFIFTNWVLVLLMHNVFCHEYDHLIKEQMNRLEIKLVTQMYDIKNEMAWLKETLTSKFNPTIDKKDPTYQVNILVFSFLATTSSVHFWH